MYEDLSPLEKARVRRQEMLDQGVVFRHNPNKTFMDNPRPMRAIRRFCWECSGYSLKDASTCENTDCALWLFRFGRSKFEQDHCTKWRKAYARHLKTVGEYIPEDDEPDDFSESVEDCEEESEEDIEE